MESTLTVINQFIHDITRHTPNGQKNQEFGMYLISLADFYQQVETLYQPDVNGIYPKLTQEILNALRDSYLSVYRATQQLKAGFGTGEAQPEASHLSDTMDAFLDRMGMDFQSLSGSLDITNKSLPEILIYSRDYRVDVTGQEISTSGGTVNSRMPLSFTDTSGTQLTGFFTASKPTSKDSELDAAIRTALEGHPEYERAIRAIINTSGFKDYFSNPDRASSVLSDMANQDKIAEEFQDLLLDGENAHAPAKSNEAKAYFSRITQDGTFFKRIVDLATAYAQLENKYSVMQVAMIDPSAPLEQRNAAMSTVADALGVSHLLARSVKMKMIRDGVETDGIFMEFANGSDMNNLKANDPLARANRDNLENPAVFKQLAELQMLDFICGNIDRHSGNMLYQFEEENGTIQLTGIQGIDNDCSFGALEPSTGNNHFQMVGSDRLFVISESMAAKIERMTQEGMQMLLKDYGLTQAEIDAAWLRTQHIQQRIAEGKAYFAQNPQEKICTGHLRVVSDDQWSQLTLNDLAFQQQGNHMRDHENYFSNLAFLPDSVASAQKEKATKEREQAALEEKIPDLKKKPFTIAEGARLEELNTAGIRHNCANVVRLGKQMLDANKGFFFGSQEFKNMMQAFQQVTGKSLQANENMPVKEIISLRGSYRDLMEKANTYLAKKEQEAVQLQDKGKKPSDVMVKRMEFARQLRKFVDARIHSLDLEMELVNQQKLTMAKKLSAKQQQTRLNEAANPDEKKAIENAYAGRGHERFEKAVLNNDVFQKFANSQSRQELQTLASGKPETITQRINQHASELANSSGLAQRQTQANPQKGSVLS